MSPVCCHNFRVLNADRGTTIAASARAGSKQRKLCGMLLRTQSTGMRRIIPVCMFALAGVLTPALGAQPDVAGHDARVARLQTEIEQVAQAAGGSVGVAVRHIESGQQVFVNRTERFPMASAFKLALAVQLLALVDQGALSLDKTVTLQRSDLRPGSGRLVNIFDDSQPAWSLHQLLELMLVYSDNSATDVIWKEAGGADAVRARLAALGVSGMSVDRPTAPLIAAAFGISLPPEGEWTAARFQELGRRVSRNSREAAAAAFFKDLRDTATPEAMIDLILKIWRREALSAQSSTLLLEIMYRCATGPKRLKGMLPSEAKVAHKTGTLQIGITNDVGIIQLPDGAGHIAIAVMVRESPQALPAQERTIAQIAWTVYRYFLDSNSRRSLK